MGTKVFCDHCQKDGSKVLLEQLRITNGGREGGFQLFDVCSRECAVAVLQNKEHAIFLPGQRHVIRPPKNG